MKIIIDINDKECFRIMSEHDGDITSYLTTVHLYDAIRKNSIPLPKGHGDLIDHNDVGEYLTLADVPTIIPADR